jgi:hypothetical protein
MMKNLLNYLQKRNELLKMLILHENDLMPREFDKKYGETITILHLGVWMCTSLN